MPLDKFDIRINDKSGMYVNVRLENKLSPGEPDTAIAILDFYIGSILN